MCQSLHLCNVFFEWELAGLAPQNLEDALNGQLAFRQLQYLPMIYGRAGEAVLATQKPTTPTPLPVYTLDQTPPITHLETWGYSLLAKKWAEKKGLHYPMPPWDVVKRINSKAYSFSKSPLPGSRLIFCEGPIEKGTILKSCYGTAGRGLILAENPRAQTFCKEEWQRGLPIIAEPFVERLVDFSTQWHISYEGAITYIGATICKTTKLGMHKSNQVKKKAPPFLEEQKACALKVLEEIALMGYFGPIGFDAMVYGNHQLQPIVEINARKTMGLVALAVQRLRAPEGEIEIAYVPKRDRLLPDISISL